jgi:hypothetical protein
VGQARISSNEHGYIISIQCRKIHKTFPLMTSHILARKGSRKVIHIPMIRNNPLSE